MKATLELTEPELAADLVERGINLCGGGALLRGMDKRIHQAIDIPVTVADDPLTAVARGTGLHARQPRAHEADPRDGRGLVVIGAAEP